MPDENQPISPSHLDLANLAQHDAPDGLLAELILLAADGGVGVGVGLLANGMIISGQLGQPEAIAAEIDAERCTMVGRATKPEDRSDEEWAADQDRFATSATASVQRFREDLAKLEEDAEAHGGKGSVDPATAPAELTRRVLDADARVHLTLERAKIFAPGERGVTQVPVMRIPVAQIAGWWILRTDEEGGTRFTLWETDVPGVTSGRQ